MATPPVFLSVSASISVHLRLSHFLLEFRSFVRGRVLVLQGTRTNEFDRITGSTGSAGHGSCLPAGAPAPLPRSCRSFASLRALRGDKGGLGSCPGVRYNGRQREAGGV